MNRLHHSLLVILLLSLLSPGNTVLAQSPSPQSEGLNQAVRSVEKSTGGKVMSAERRRVDGKQKYRIKVLTPSGRVRVIHVDAKE